MRHIVCTALLVCGVALIATPERVSACPDTGFAGCPCRWAENVIPVYALTEPGQWSIHNSLLNLSPARSKSEWERIITNAINIYRENSGLPRRLKFVGFTDQLEVSGGITIEASDWDCNSDLAYTQFAPKFPQLNEIGASRIELRETAMLGGACNIINWDPRLLQQSTTPPFNHDPVVFLVHELGHALGLDHPNEDCGTPGLASVMNSSVPIWGRHLTRYDKNSLFSQYYSTQNPQGTTYQYNGGTTWNLVGTWSIGGSSLWSRPGPVTTHRHRPIFAFVDNEAGGVGGGSGKITTLLNTSGTTFTVIDQGKIVPTYNPPATVYGGGGHVRMYVFREYTTSGAEADRKEICYYESLNSGISWGSLTCPMIASSTIKTRRDGLAAAFDWKTKNYIVLYTADNATCTPYCDEITAFVQPGVGSSLPPNSVVPWHLTHHSFSPPSIVCRDSVDSNRCLIAFSTADAQPVLRWVEGGLNSNGFWTQTADLFQSLALDQSPSVVWSTYYNKFIVATGQRTYQWSRVDTWSKTIGATSWTFSGGWLTSTGSFSAPVLTSVLPGAAGDVRMYYAQYAE